MMTALWARAVERFGLLNCVFGLLLVGVVAYFGLSFGYSKVAAWYYQGKSERLQTKLDGARADLHQTTETQAASTQARQTNDERIPEVRHATAGRIARADRATDAERLRDDADALAAYAAAADRLRGKSAD